MPRVLIVEDNAQLRKIYVSVLSKEGFEVDVAGDGREALQKVRAAPPDLILLDVMMPNLDGLGFLKEFDVASHPDTKVVVFSNSDQPQKVQDALRLGAVRFMSKYNQTPKNMVALIRDVLDRKGP